MAYEWIIYYADGSSFSNEDGPPEDAPRDGGQVLVNYSAERGKLPWHSMDYICWQDGTWVTHMFDGLLTYLAAPGKEKIVVHCYAIPPKKFMEVWDIAVKDPRMPWVTSEPLKPQDPLFQYPPTIG